jgi:O-antigen ligase
MRILLLMIVLMPFERNPYLYIAQSFLGIIPDFTAIKAVGLLGLGWAASQASGGVRLGLLKSAQARALAAFIVLVTFLSVVNGAGVLVANRILSTVLFLPLVLAAVRNARELRRVLMLCAAIYVLVLPYSYRNAMRFGGRLGTGLSEANYLALNLVLLLPLAVVFARVSRPRSTLWVVAAAVLALEIFMTGSRGGFVGLVAVAVLLILRFAKRRLLITTGMIALLVVGLFLVPTTMSERLLGSVLGDEIERADVAVSNAQRQAVLIAGLRMIVANPVSGVGLGQFKDEMMHYVTPDAAPHIAHNTYLEIAAELGVPALIVFLTIPVATYLSLRRSEQLAITAGARGLRDFAVALEIGLCGYLVSATFLSAQYEKFFWLVVFLSICLERIARVAARDVAATPRAAPEAPAGAEARSG